MTLKNSINYIKYMKYKTKDMEENTIYIKYKTEEDEEKDIEH